MFPNVGMVGWRIATEDFWSTGSGARKRTWKMVPSEGAQVEVDVACTYKDDVLEELMAFRFYLGYW